MLYLSREKILILGVLPLKGGVGPRFCVIQEKPAVGIIFVSFSILPSFNVIFKVINQFLKNMRWTHCEQYDRWRSCIHFFNNRKLFLHLKKQLDLISVPNACYMKWCLSTSFTSYVTKQSLSTWDAFFSFVYSTFMFFKQGCTS